MSSSQWVRHPDNSRDGLFNCGCGSRIIVCWNPGADFECPKCNAEYNSSGQRLAPREQWGEETGEHPADVAASFKRQVGSVHDPIGDLIATAENLLLHGDMSSDERAAREAVIDNAKRYVASMDVPPTNPAAVWYAANSMLDHLLSLGQEYQDRVIEEAEGQDRWMEAVAIPAAIQFVRWSEIHIDFDVFDEVWCYWLDEHFGKLAFAANRLGNDGDQWCHHIAFEAGLPLCGEPSPSQQ